MSIRREDKPTVRSFVKDARREVGMTQEDLAERVGVSRRAIQFIEYGAYSPTVGVALRLALALRCDVEDLFRLDDPDWSPGTGHPLNGPR